MAGSPIIVVACGRAPTQGVAAGRRLRALLIDANAGSARYNIRSSLFKLQRKVLLGVMSVSCRQAGRYSCAHKLWKFSERWTDATSQLSSFTF